ncbi:MAG: DUF402 domain-containing protein [Desulfurococcaceae archaeon]
MVSVRVRGIYATAISKILLESGFKLVEASEKVRERLGIDLDAAPCDVTVKDCENVDELLVVGFPGEAGLVYKVLLDSLKYVFRWESPVELHAVYVGRVTSKQGELCVVDIGGTHGSLYPCKEEAGSKVVVGVKKPPLKPQERLILTRNFRIVGKYIALVHGEPRISFSEHIRDSSVRARLSVIAASKLAGSGLGIHFRSSSKYADSRSIASEVDVLLEEYRNLLKRAEEAREPAKLRDGEFIAILGLTSLAKQLLDGYRRQVTYTIDMHHSLKSMGLSDLVDFAEHLLMHSSGGRGEGTGAGVATYIVKNLLETGTVEFLHVRPTGEVIRLQPGRVVNARVESNRLVMVVERTIKSEGTYDGLNVERRPGDVDYVVVDTGKPVLSHNYHRAGSWLGSYVNINTPPEVAPGVVKYHDLLIDVVIHPSGETRLVDVEELERLREQGAVTDALYLYAKRAVEDVLANPYGYVYNPSRNLEK